MKRKTFKKIIKKIAHQIVTNLGPLGAIYLIHDIVKDIEKEETKNDKTMVPKEKPSSKRCNKKQKQTKETNTSR